MQKKTELKKPRILFLDILTDDKRIRQEIFTHVYDKRTYSEAMRHAAGYEQDAWEACDGPFARLPASLDLFDGIIIGGSLKNPVYKHERFWMRNIYKFIRRAAEKEIPILGICGGLQFTARAFGEEVIFNPRGREMGTVKITATSAGARDPLFSGISETFLAQASHKCMVGKLPRAWKLLGSSALCKTQAIAAGSSIRLLQFHPEMTTNQLRALAMLRRKHLINEGFVGDEKDFTKFTASFKNTEKTGKKILKNFIDHFVVPHYTKKQQQTVQKI